MFRFLLHFKLVAIDLGEVTEIILSTAERNRRSLKNISKDLSKISQKSGKSENWIVTTVTVQCPNETMARFDVNGQTVTNEGLSLKAC